MISNLPLSNEKLEEFRKETTNAVTLTKLIETVLNGWPETKSQAAQEIRAYWNFREEISVVNGVLYKGERLIVPAAMRGEMLKRIHESHLKAAGGEQEKYSFGLEWQKISQRW